MNQEVAVRQFTAIKTYADKTSMRLAAEGWDAEWKILVSIMMSAQTRDETTIEVAEALFKKYPTPKKLGSAPISEIENMIKRVNYFRTKAKNVQACASHVAANGMGYTVESLIEIPGVGRKTANVFLNEIGKKDAIGVDTHVYRISHKLGWARGNTPDKVEQELLELFPKSYWNKINSTLVRFGKGYGTSRTKEDEILKEIKKL